MEKFVEQLSEIKTDIFKKININKPMDITTEQEIELRKAKRCSICNKNFKPEKMKKLEMPKAKLLFSLKAKKSATTVISLVNIEVRLITNVI